LELYKISNKIVDIHPIGGIEDKIVILLMCIIASLNVPIAKISGRELGLEDRMLSIPKFDNNVDFEKLKDIIGKTNMGIIAAPMDIAPVEENMYRLRNNISCNDDISLIAMSIMSQKIAIGTRNIVFDITCGENAYVKNYADAKKMASYFINIGKNVNKNVKCVISSINEPVGSYFGNLLEINEVIDGLKGNMLKDVQEMIFALGFKVLQIIGVTTSEKESRKKILECIESGKAYESFKKFLEYQNIDIKDIKSNEEVKCVVPIISTIDGYVKEIDVSKVRKTGINLNAIKIRKEDKLDIGAGIKLCKKVGDKVKNGEILAYIYTNDDTKIRRAKKEIADAYLFTDKKVSRKSRILGVIE